MAILGEWTDEKCAPQITLNDCEVEPCTAEDQCRWGAQYVKAKAITTAAMMLLRDCGVCGVKWEGTDDGEGAHVAVPPRWGQPRLSPDCCAGVTVGMLRSPGDRVRRSACITTTNEVYRLKVGWCRPLPTATEDECERAAFASSAETAMLQDRLAELACCLVPKCGPKDCICATSLTLTTVENLDDTGACAEAVFTLETRPL